LLGSGAQAVTLLELRVAGEAEVDLVPARDAKSDCVARSSGIGNCLRLIVLGIAELEQQAAGLGCPEAVGQRVADADLRERTSAAHGRLRRTVGARRSCAG
jgi:hypothetical protein